MRGMGTQKPEGLRINRSLWLDENGRGITFRDHIAGQMQQIWRLDAAPGQDLGSVLSDGQGLLVTRNSKNGAAGVEIRSRNLNLEATGRIEHTGELPASGWQADTDALNVTLNIPPGWRLLALFGADWVRGDWLTAWSLLDLFLLLVFSLAVFRLWGVRTAILALLAFGLSYQEPGAPRYVWLVLLMPLALLRVVPDGWGRRLGERFGNGLRSRPWSSCWFLSWPDKCSRHCIRNLSLLMRSSHYPRSDSKRSTCRALNRRRQPTRPARKLLRPSVSPRQSPTAISCMNQTPASRRARVSPIGHGGWRALAGMDPC